MTDSTNPRITSSTLSFRTESGPRDSDPTPTDVLLSGMMPHPIRPPRLGVAAVALLIALQLSDQALAHAKGLYKTQAEAEKRAKELGCNGTHLNNGFWMPCSGEAMLHQELRQE
jgi:hypothetical protein